MRLDGNRDSWCGSRGRRKCSRPGRLNNNMCNSSRGGKRCTLADSEESCRRRLDGNEDSRRSN